MYVQYTRSPKRSVVNAKARNLWPLGGPKKDPPFIASSVGRAHQARFGHFSGDETALKRRLHNATDLDRNVVSFRVPECGRRSP